MHLVQRRVTKLCLAAMTFHALVESPLSFSCFFTAPLLARPASPFKLPRAPAPPLLASASSLVPRPAFVRTEMHWMVPFSVGKEKLGTIVISSSCAKK